MGSCLCLILRCSFRIILILIRYVATISMKAFYDDETLLKIAFKTLLRFLAGINRLSYSVHSECSSRQPTAWRCSFRIILILIRYVATISMKAFYDDETLLKIAFKTLLRFLAGINRLSYSVHSECSSRQPTAWLFLLQCTFSWHF